MLVCGWISKRLRSHQLCPRSQRGNHIICKSTIAIAITAALTAQAFLATDTFAAPNRADPEPVQHTTSEHLNVPRGSSALYDQSGNFLPQVFGSVNGVNDCIFASGFDDQSDACGGNVIDSGVLDITANEDNTGLYINWLTDDTCDSGADGAANGCYALGYDFNPYVEESSLQFVFANVLGHVSNCVAADATSCDALNPGASIGAGSQFELADATNFQVAGPHYMGFSFLNLDTGMTNYGYVKMTGGSATGLPLILNQYWYDSSGVAITVR